MSDKKRSARIAIKNQRKNNVAREDYEQHVRRAAVVESHRQLADLVEWFSNFTARVYNHDQLVNEDKDALAMLRKSHEDAKASGTRLKFNFASTTYIRSVPLGVNPCQYDSVLGAIAFNARQVIRLEIDDWCVQLIKSTPTTMQALRDTCVHPGNSMYMYDWVYHEVWRLSAIKIVQPMLLPLILSVLSLPDLAAIVLDILFCTSVNMYPESASGHPRTILL